MAIDLFDAGGGGLPRQAQEETSRRLFVGEEFDTGNPIEFLQALIKVARKTVNQIQKRLKALQRGAQRFGCTRLREPHCG